MKNKKQLCYYLIFLISLTGTIASLYFSEVLGYIPCKLCNFQRIFLYPITIISLVAFINKDKNAGIRYVLPLAIFGMAIALYHYLLQLNIIKETITKCNSGIPCKETYFKLFGFVTIPLLSFINFSAIIFFIVLGKKNSKD